MGMTLFFRSPLEPAIDFLFHAIAIKGFITFGNYYFPLVCWMQIALSRVPCIVSPRTTYEPCISSRSFLQHINADNDAKPIRNYPDKRNSVRWIKSATTMMSPSLPSSLPPSSQFAHVARSTMFFVILAHHRSIHLSPALSSLRREHPAGNFKLSLPSRPDERAGERKREERDRIARTENKARAKRRSVFGFVACILINRVDIAARNFVLPRDDDTSVPKVTIVAKTVRSAKLNCRYFVCQS